MQFHILRYGIYSLGIIVLAALWSPLAQKNSLAAKDRNKCGGKRSGNVGADTRQVACGARSLFPPAFRPTFAPGDVRGFGTPGVGRIKARNRDILARRPCFQARRIDLSVRAWFGVVAERGHAMRGRFCSADRGQDGWPGPSVGHSHVARSNRDGAGVVHHAGPDVDPRTNTPGATSSSCITRRTATELSCIPRTASRTISLVWAREF
jgi:hypothetical protein